MNKREIVENFVNGYFNGTIKIHHQLNEVQVFYIRRWQELQEIDKNSEHLEKITNQLFDIICELRGYGTNMIENVFDSNHEKRINDIEKEIKQIKNDIKKILNKMYEFEQQSSSMKETESDFHAIG